MSDVHHEESGRMGRRRFLRAAAGTAALPAAVARTAESKRLVGITVLPEYIQSEGIDGVLGNLARAGANAVTTSPYVMAEADERTGTREPPADAGAGSVRLLDRPLWGRREVWVTTAPSFEPRRELYAGLRYQPPQPTELTRREGPVVERFVSAAKRAGLRVYFQVQAAIPPGYRVQFGGPAEEDQPRLPDGSLPPRRLDKNGTLASPEIAAYEHALVRDLLTRYPEIDGIRFDWPEFPPYFLDSCFLDFGPHARAAAERSGFDFERMRRDVEALYRQLHGGLRNEDLEAWAEGDGGRFGLLRAWSDRPGIGEFLRFKAVLAEEFVAGLRRVMTEVAGPGKELLANAFPPPWSLASGLDFSRVGKHAAAMCCKLYSMHWAMMLRFYGEALREANPGLDERLLVRALVRILDIADDEGLPRLADYAYPEPDTPHPAGTEAMKRKIRQAQREAGDTPVQVLAHGYGPVDDFRRRLVAARDAGPHGFWVNRYAYLTGEKLSVIGEVARGGD
jgi:hypothetical protein